MRVLIYDASEQSFVGRTWCWGAALFRQRFDYILPAESWDDAEYAVSLLERVDELQFWGHGGQGRPLIDRVPMTKSFAETLGTKTHDDSLVWFRSCYVFGGATGQSFARAMVRVLGCRVAAHTRLVHVWQSGLYSLSPGGMCSWPVDEAGTSAPWRRHTVLCLRMRCPDEW